MPSTDGVWPTFIALAILSTPIVIGAAFAGWFGLFAGAFIAYLIFKALLTHGRKARRRY
jgi:hypothetical protein